MAEQAMVIVDIVKKSDGSEAPPGFVEIRTSLGARVYVPEKDVYARKPNPEDAMRKPLPANGGVE